MVNACGRLNNKLFQSLASKGGTYHPKLGLIGLKLALD